MISATHNSTGAMNPDYNSIASWVEVSTDLSIHLSVCLFIRLSTFLSVFCFSECKQQWFPRVCEGVE